MTAALMACAPWLPPKTRSVGARLVERAGHVEKLAPHRNSGDHGSCGSSGGGCEVHRSGVHHGRHQAIGDAGNDVRLERHHGHVRAGRPPASPGRRRSRRRRSSRRDETPHDPCRADYALHAARSNNCLDARRQIDAVERSDGHQLQLETRRPEPGASRCRVPCR